MTRWARRAVLPGVVATLLMVGLFAVEPIRIRSNSMAPTLIDGQRVVLDKVSFRLRLPRRGELVAFHAPADHALTLKRTVGLPGDLVAIEDGRLRVNGRFAEEPYVDHRLVDSVYYGPVTVPPAAVLVMGDNRGESVDSRRYGPVPTADLVGRVLWTAKRKRSAR